VKRKHHELKAWQEAMELVKDIYSITASFPREELYGLTGQLRRAAVSVPSNIAEGAARTGTKEFLKFLSISRGSLSELETQLIISRELNFLNSEEKIFEKINKVFGLIGGLMKSLSKEKN
jgi:four helix bundle protein